MDQMETFDVIGMLRELGMPLAEIRNYLEQRSPENSEYCWNRRRRWCVKNAAAPRDAALDRGKEAVSGTGIGGMP